MEQAYTNSLHSACVLISTRCYGPKGIGIYIILTSSVCVDVLFRTYTNKRMTGVIITCTVDIDVSKR